MTTADYRCDACGEVVERDSSHFANGKLPETMVSYCDEKAASAIMRRIWTPPHTGPGSSGEPMH